MQLHWPKDVAKLAKGRCYTGLKTQPQWPKDAAALVQGRSLSGLRTQFHWPKDAASLAKECSNQPHPDTHAHPQKQDQALQSHGSHRADVVSTTHEEVRSSNRGWVHRHSFYLPMLVVQVVLLVPRGSINSYMRRSRTGVHPTSCPCGYRHVRQAVAGLDHCVAPHIMRSKGVVRSGSALAQGLPGAGGMRVSHGAGLPQEGARSHTYFERGARSHKMR
eukprot:1144159-Pelagomonas_calceolata.AAC.6